MNAGTSLSMSSREVVTGRLRMTGDRLLLRPLSWNEHGDASKLIAVERKGNALRGVVVEAGPGIYPVARRLKSHDGKSVRIEYSKHFRRTEVKPGDIVELGGLNIFDGNGYAFEEIIYNGVPHLIVTERDVCVVRDDLAVPA